MVFSKLTLPLAAFAATTVASPIHFDDVIADSAFSLIKNDHGVESGSLDSAQATGFSIIDQRDAVSLKGLSGYGGGFNPDCSHLDWPCLHSPNGFRSFFRRYDGKCTSSKNVMWGSNGEIMPRGFTGGTGNAGGSSTDSSGMETTSIYFNGVSSWGMNRTNPSNIRSISNNHCKVGANDTTSDGGSASNTINADPVRNDATITWAQVMDHDLDATTPEDQKNCAASKFDKNTYFLGTNHDLVALKQDRTCPTVKNVITSVVDAGILYGETRCERDRLFDSNTGLGLATAGTDGEYLPTSRQLCGGMLACNAGVSGVSMANPTKRSCFYAGDFRAGENPALTGYHTLMLRMHNFIVRNNFSGSAPFGSQFEKVRASVIAEEQYITYNEWLPAYTGNPGAYKFTTTGIEPGVSNSIVGRGGLIRWTGYNSDIRPSVRQHFATGTFRQHTGVNHKMHLEAQGGNLELDQSFFESCVWYTNGGPGCTANNSQGWRDSDIPRVGIRNLCDILAGQTQTMMRKGDTIMITEQRNQLFYKKDRLGNNPAPYGPGGNRGGESGANWKYEGSSNLDLVALNVFRGRDHGLRTWQHFTQAFFGGATAADPISFCAATDGCVHGVSIGNAVYESASDIDLWIGALAEKKLRNSGTPGGIISALGSTLTRDVVTQFRDLRDGDQHWDHSHNSRVESSIGLNKWLSILTGADCFGSSHPRIPPVWNGNPFIKTQKCVCRWIPNQSGGLPEETFPDAPPPGLHGHGSGSFSGAQMQMFSGGAHFRRRLNARGRWFVLPSNAIPGSSDSQHNKGICGHQ